MLMHGMERAAQRRARPAPSAASGLACHLPWTTACAHDLLAARHTDQETSGIRPHLRASCSCRLSRRWVGRVCTQHSCRNGSRLYLQANPRIYCDTGPLPWPLAVCFGVSSNSGLCSFPRNDIDICPMFVRLPCSPSVEVLFMASASSLVSGLVDYVSNQASPSPSGEPVGAWGNR